MPPPTHRAGCSTRTFPTTCRDCGETVFYFECSCESKVFFDELGNSWPRHSDRCIPYLLRTLVDQDHSVPEIRNLIASKARELNQPIPAHVLQRLAVLDARGGITIRYVPVMPTANVPPILARVGTVEHGVNFYKRLNIQKGTIGDQLLGILSKQSYAMLQLRCEPDGRNISYEYSVFVNQDLFNRINPRTGNELLIHLSVHRIAGRDSMWIATDIELT